MAHWNYFFLDRYQIGKQTESIFLATGKFSTWTLTWECFQNKRQLCAVEGFIHSFVFALSLVKHM